MVFQTRVFLILMILISGHFCVACAVNLHTEPIDSLFKVDQFLQMTHQNVTHAWTMVKDCKGGIQATSKRLGCKSTLRWADLLQRMTKPGCGNDLKVVFMQLESEVCDTIDRKRDLLRLHNYRSVWLGMQMIKGPESKIETYVNKKCINKENRDGVGNLFLFYRRFS